MELPPDYKIKAAFFCLQFGTPGGCGTRERCGGLDAIKPAGLTSHIDTALAVLQRARTAGL